MRIICNLIIALLFFVQVVEAKDAFLSADKIEYHDTGDYAEATGHVKVIFDKYTIHADRVYYDLKKDEVFGYGNIKAIASGKEVVLGDAIIFDAKAKKSLISSLVLYFKENDSIIAARFAQKIDDHHERLTKAVYTSCPTCENKKPLWEISAQQVDIYDEKYKVVYKNAFFKIYGMPVAYFPYFSHTMPGAPSTSGVLTPGIQKKRLGIPLYWRAKSNLDVTFTPKIGAKGILYEGEIRHLLKTGQYKLNGSFTNSQVALSTSTDKENNKKPTRNDRYTRYNIAGEGKFTKDHYHFGLDLNQVSDRGYLKEYYNKDIPFLVSKLYMYKTTKQNFVEVNNLYLQGLGSDDSKFNNPHIIPEVNLRYVIPFEQLNDTNLNIENYSAAYSTDALGQITRTIWSTSLYNNYNIMGQIWGVELYNRADFYKMQLADKKEFTTGRTIPELRFSWRYPWGGNIANKAVIIEPIALMALGKKHEPDINKFGKIDSNSYDFSDTNFYQYNRYNGIDFHEYGKRITYGVNSALNINDAHKISLFLGQFQKLSASADQRSDIVGRTSLNFYDQLEIYYRFKKAPRNFASHFDEVGAWYNDNKFSANGGYVSAHDITLPNDNKKISQIYLDGGYNITEKWNIGGGFRFDTTKKKLKSLSDTMRVTYHGECAKITLTLNRDYSVDTTRSIKKSRDYSFAIGLRTLTM